MVRASPHQSPEGDSFPPPRGSLTSLRVFSYFGAACGDNQFFSLLFSLFTAKLAQPIYVITFCLCRQAEKADKP
ncbi:MAG: hypothetical protein ACI4RP_09175 [Acutalibacteraceae bacterium]